MSKATNVVLYAVEGGERRALLSLDKAAKNGAAKLQHAATKCFADAEKRGVPYPELVTVRETRAADENGRITESNFLELDMATLEAAKSGDKGGADLNKVFVKESA